MNYKKIGDSLSCIAKEVGENQFLSDTKEFQKFLNAMLSANLAWKSLLQLTIDTLENKQDWENVFKI